MATKEKRALSPTGVAILSDAPLDDANRDYFGFRVYAEAIASVIDNDLTDTPLTIAVSAPWGGGKTSVAKMVRHRLAERTASRGQDRPVLACWFDAWMHNDAPHLGAALATAVARTTNCARPMWRRLLNPLPVAMLGPQERTRRRVLIGFVAAIVATVVVVITPLNERVSVLLGHDLPKNVDTTGPLLTSLLLALGVARSVFRAAEDAAQFVDDPRSEAARGSMARVREQLGSLID
ncbi:MAG: KAP family NTPase, partial [Actinobacteria bacterium]|nr:KAP family NTPase [Actinomycetota bacterium]